MSVEKKSTLTTKQWKIMTVLCHGNGTDENGKFIPCDIDELLERLAYRTSKSSMQFSLRALIARGMIEKEECELRRGARRRVIVPTRAARHMMGYRDPSFVEEDLSYLDV